MCARLAASFSVAAFFALNVRSRSSLHALSRCFITVVYFSTGTVAAAAAVAVAAAAVAAAAVVVALVLALVPWLVLTAAGGKSATVAAGSVLRAAVLAVDWGTTPDDDAMACFGVGFGFGLMASAASRACLCFRNSMSRALCSTKK
jgi:hypothetical protein